MLARWTIPALLLPCLPAGAIEVASPGPGWEEANRTESLVVFTKGDSGGGARKVIAVGTIAAPPEAVFRAICDFEHYPDFMPYVKESRVLARKEDGTLFTYTRVKPPLVSERDYVIEVKLTPGDATNGGVFKSTWESRPDLAPERPGVVRVKPNTGAWILEPLDGGKRTRATYQIHTHPGGDIPDWIADKSNTTSLPELFLAVGKRAEG